MYFHEAEGDELLRSALTIRASQGLGISNKELIALIWCAAKGQLYLARSEKNELIGYMAYARITKYTMDMVAKSRDHTLRRPELNEGHIFLIVDLVTARDHSRQALSILKSAVKNRRLICGYRGGEFRLFRRTKFTFRRVGYGVTNASSNTGYTVPRFHFTLAN